MATVRASRATLPTRLVALVLGLIGIVGAVRAWTLGLTDSGTAGPGMVPMAAFFMVTGCSLWILVRPSAESELSTDNELEDEAGEKAGTADLRSVAVCTGLTIVYVSLLSLVGFLIATAAFSFTLVRYAGASIRTSIIVAIGLPLGTYLLFQMVLQLHLPTGFGG